MLRGLISIACNRPHDLVSHAPNNAILNLFKVFLSDVEKKKRNLARHMADLQKIVMNISNVSFITLDDFESSRELQLTWF